MFGKGLFTYLLMKCETRHNAPAKLQEDTAIWRPASQNSHSTFHQHCTDHVTTDPSTGPSIHHHRPEDFHQIYSFEQSRKNVLGNITNTNKTPLRIRAYCIHAIKRSMYPHQDHYTKSKSLLSQRNFFEKECQKCFWETRAQRRTPKNLSPIESMWAWNSAMRVWEQNEERGHRYLKQAKASRSCRWMPQSSSSLCWGQRSWKTNLKEPEDRKAAAVNKLSEPDRNWQEKAGRRSVTEPPPPSSTLKNKNMQTSLLSAKALASPSSYSSLRKGLH